MSQPEFIQQESVKIKKSVLACTKSRLSFDNGTTLCKIAYLSECDREHWQLNLLTVSRRSFADTIRWIKRTGRHLLKCDGSDVVKMTGVNFNFKELFQEVFKASCEHVNELLTVVRGMHWLLSNVEHQQILLPDAKAETEFATHIDNEMADQIFKQFGGSKPPAPTPLPAVVAQIGSGGVITVVSESGTLQGVHVTPLSGKPLLGLSQLLLGTNDYDKLLALAAAGDRRKVDLQISEVIGTDPNGPYGRFDPQLPMMHFGKLAELGHVSAAKPEHVARSLVSMFCWNLYGFVSSLCQTTGVNRVYFTGNFFRHPLTLVELANAKALMGQNAAFELKFLRIGGHVGAVGALISTNADAPTYMHISIPA